MGHEEGGDTALCQDSTQGRAQLFSARPVQGGEGLVQEEKARFRGQGPCQGHTLALPTREFRRLALSHALQADQFHQVLDALGSVGALQPLYAEGDVGCHVEMRKESGILEYQPHMTLVSGAMDPCLGIEPSLLSDLDMPFFRPLEARKTAQNRGLAAAGGAEENRDGETAQIPVELGFDCRAMAVSFEKFRLQFHGRSFALKMEVQSRTMKARTRRNSAV